jgi:hypothetical protein
MKNASVPRGVFFNADLLFFLIVERVNIIHL